MGKLTNKECEECECLLTKENTKTYKQHKDILCDECALQLGLIDEDEEY